jgi:alkylation response protein AidB-like acyl-CoA dehydrogenase
MQKLSEEQEILALIADIVIEIFAMESALLRTLKKVEKEGIEKSGIQIAATRVYCNDAFPKVDMMAKQIFAAISEGEELRTGLLALKRLARHTPINSIVLRREIADSGIAAARYNLTKL